MNFLKKFGDRIKLLKATIMNNIVSRKPEDIASGMLVWFVFMLIVIFIQYAILNYQISSVRAEIENMQQHNIEIQDDLNTSINMLSNRISSNEADMYSNMDAMQNSIDRLYETTVETKLLEMQLEMNQVEKLKDIDLKEYYLEYMNLCEKYADWIDPPETIYDCCSSEEIYYLQRMVETETCGADFASRVHVADVALNRVNDEAWPNDIVSVITQPHQFAYVKTQISEDTILAVEYAYMFPDETFGALAFHSNAKTDTFSGYIFLFEDAVSHKFYGHQIRGEK